MRGQRRAQLEGGRGVRPFKGEGAREGSGGSRERGRGHLDAAPAMELSRKDATAGCRPPRLALGPRMYVLVRMCGVAVPCGPADPGQAQCTLGQVRRRRLCAGGLGCARSPRGRKRRERAGQVWRARSYGGGDAGRLRRRQAVRHAVGKHILARRCDGDRPAVQRVGFGRGHLTRGSGRAAQHRAGSEAARWSAQGRAGVSCCASGARYGVKAGVLRLV
jgi:hypothetical protein